MHIPDNYLSPATCAVMGAAMLPVWAISVRKVRAELSRARLPLLGIGAAFSFVFMMFNIPLPGGTTGHAVGGTLIVALLGPWAACISLSVALLIQALLFGDGGILSFAANCFNMAFVLPFSGWLFYRLAGGREGRGRRGLVAIGLASYLAINLAALFAALEFGLQPLVAADSAGLALYCPYPLAVSIPAMTIPHLLVAGPVEAAFTVAVFAFIRRVSPGSVAEGAQVRTGALYGLLVGLVCLSPLGLLASGTAWGEWAPSQIAALISEGRPLGFVPEGMKGGLGLGGLFPDYAVEGLPAWAGYAMSAVAGAAILVIVFKLVSQALGRPSARARGV